MEQVDTSNMQSRHIFISYAREDGREHAARLEKALSQYGFTAWRDVRHIDPTQDYTAELEQAIEAASYVVICVTPDVRRGNSFVRREISYAQVIEKPVVLARFDAAPRIVWAQDPGAGSWCGPVRSHGAAAPGQSP